MNEAVLAALKLVQGPVFRFAFALMMLGMLRALLLALSDTTAAYLTSTDRTLFWRKLRMRLLWLTFPSVVLRRIEPGGSRLMYAYHLGLCLTSLVFRLTAVIVPAFMVEHVYLWERGLGLTWQTLRPATADVLSLITIAAGLLLFLGRLYSPVLRRIEPGWSFLKPLLLIVPFITGVLAMHPTWSPIDYHVVLLMHVLSAALVFVMVPFARMLTCIHTRLTDVIPEAAWDGDAAVPAAAGARE